MKIQDYTVIFHPESKGGFTAVVPSLPGCVTYGKTLADAKTMVIDAIHGYIASLVKHNEPVPTDEATFISTVHIHSMASSVAYA